MAQISNLESDEKPCLVNARQGFSVLYRNRHLYSKYDPAKSILEIVKNLKLLPGTLILCNSPCLCYGLQELLSALPENCFVLGVEFDARLHDLALEYFPKSDSHCALLPYEYLSGSGLMEYLTALTSTDGILNNEINFPKRGNLRRVVKIDFSAGTGFSKSCYDNFFILTQNVITQFWKNRLTLVRFGRLYSRNIFKNLGQLNRAIPFTAIQKSVEKPVIVFGAGESIETAIARLKEQQDEYFIIAVDAAFSALKAAGIKCDAVIGVESQIAIEKAYIGARLNDKQKNDIKAPLFICDLTSRPALARNASELCFFFSEYDKNPFITRIQKLNETIPVIPPLGSVGLSAVCIALLLRKNDSVPVFVCGLDFSFSAGITHGKGTTQHKVRLSTSSRLNPAANYGAAFGAGTQAFTGKNGKKVFAGRALYDYAILFNDYFKGTANLFDIGKSGLNLGIPQTELPQLHHKYGGIPDEKTFSAKDFIQQDKNILEFIRNEKEALLTLKDILINGDTANFRKPEIPLDTQVLELLAGRDYLFLHYPDGYSARTDTGFLKRIRSEIDFFLKDCTLAEKMLQKQKTMKNR